MYSYDENARHGTLYNKYPKHVQINDGSELLITLHEDFHLLLIPGRKCTPWHIIIDHYILSIRSKHV